MRKAYEFSALNPLFTPRAIAVIGASADTSKSSARVLINLQKCRYQGSIYPVNPNYQEIFGLKCYPSLMAVPEPVDVALIALSPQKVLSCLEACEKKGVKFLLIFSSGFAEHGQEGRQRQQALREFARRTGIRVCGPNSAGLINIKERLGYSFSPQFNPGSFQPGGIALITQGGGVGRAILDAQERGVGFNYWICSGNEADLELADFVNYCLEDPNTDVILAVIQTLRDGRKFAAIAEKALEKKKPLVVLKLGKSPAGRKAAMAHMGSSAGCEQVYDAMFRQKKVVRVDDLDQLLGVGTMFGRYKNASGKRIGIFSFSGSIGVLLADMCGFYHLCLPPLSGRTKEKLSLLRPPLKNAANPLDITTAVYDYPELFSQALEVFVDDPNIDVVILPFPFKLGEINEKMATSLIRVASQSSKPIIPVWLSKGIIRERGYELLAESGLPLFYGATQCLATMRAYLEYGLEEGELANNPTPADYSPENNQCALLPEAEEGKLAEWETRKLLESYNIPLAEWSLASSLPEAAAVSAVLGYPVLMKPNRSYKRSGEKGFQAMAFIGAEEELPATYQQMCQAQAEGHPLSVIIQKMEHGRNEIIIRLFQDSQFGSIIGLALKESNRIRALSCRIAPVTTKEAESWLLENQDLVSLIDPAHRCVSLQSLVQILVKLSNLAHNWEHPGMHLQLLVRDSTRSASFQVFDISDISGFGEPDEAFGPGNSKVVG
ncbi:MAG: acetate--CoA ligase family protein [Bacillota bacterium]